jgi:predicted amidohydrolase
MSRSFRLALAQMPVVGGKPDLNLGCAEDCIARAAADGAEVVLLPEALDCGWCHESARSEAGAIPDGVACLRLREAARKHAVHVCAGLIERAGDRLFNSAVLISPQGEMLLHHRKLNELEMAHPIYGLGDRLGVAETPLGAMGLMICADAFAPGQVISRTLGMMGAQIILSPCAWAVPPDHDNAREPYGKLWLDNYGPVATDFEMWIAGASNVGWITDGGWSGHPCIGCSLVMDATGEAVLRGPYGPEAEALLFVNVTFPPRSIRPDGRHRDEA